MLRYVSLFASKHVGQHALKHYDRHDRKQGVPSRLPDTFHQRRLSHERQNWEIEGFAHRPSIFSSIF